MSKKAPIKVADLPIFDPADHLGNEASIQAFLTDAKEEDDPRWLPIALAHVARARLRWGLPAQGEESPLPLEVKTRASRTG